MTKYARYEIEYISLNGQRYTIYEQPTKGWEDQFPQKVLNRVQSLVMAGAVITKIIGYRQ